MMNDEYSATCVRNPTAPTPAKSLTNWETDPTLFFSFASAVIEISLTRCLVGHHGPWQGASINKIALQLM
jgi:hypothetical protein